MIHSLSDCQSKNIGKNTNVWQFCVVLPNAQIGENCNICSHCFIENDVKIGNNVTIKCGVQLWDGIEIEDDVFIGPNVTFTNDKYPRSKQYPEKFLKTKICKGASIGANSTICPGITIGEKAMVGAGSVVTKDVKPNSLVKGNPAQIYSKIDLQINTDLKDIVKEKHYCNLDELINDFRELTKDNDEFIFRGQNSSKYLLQDSWRRYSARIYEPWMNCFEEILDRFIDGLICTNITIKGLSHESSIEEKLELARHHGLPTPCIDFSYSPFIALFFAFDKLETDKIRKSLQKNEQNWSVVYAINKNKMAELWSRLHSKLPNDESYDEKKLKKFYNRFLFDDKTFFKKNNDTFFPENELKFIPYSGMNNRRMQKQLGCLMYDTLNYERSGCNDLEDYIRKILSNCYLQKDETVMYKFYISHKLIGDVFRILELMNINEGTLYNSIEGVVQDCKNKYYYNSIYSLNKIER